MTTLKPQRAPGGTLAAWAWGAVALTPVGWFYGALAAAYSHLGDVVDVNQMITGVLLFVAAPSSAFILAIHAARAGHRSGKIAVIAAGLLLLATIVVTLLYGGWIGLAVTAVVAVLVLAWVRSRRIAVAVSGSVLRAAGPRPVLIIAGGAVPDEPAAARWFQAASPATVRVWVVPQAGHTAALTTQPRAWEAQVSSFLTAALNPGTMPAPGAGNHG